MPKKWAGPSFEDQVAVAEAKAANAGVTLDADGNPNPQQGDHEHDQGQVAMSLDTQYRQLVTDITSDNEKPVPKEALETLSQVASGDANGAKRELSALLAKRLEQPSISVKLKALRVIMVLGTKGDGAFAAHLQSNAAEVMRSHTEFDCPVDPVHGEKPKLMIRAAAVKCLRVGRVCLHSSIPPFPPRGCDACSCLSHCGGADYRGASGSRPAHRSAGQQGSDGCAAGCPRSSAAVGGADQGESWRCGGEARQR